MRKWIDLLSEGDHDDLHAQALQDTGFWGSKGAGVVFLSKSTGRLCLAHRGKLVEQPGTYGTWGGAIDPGENPEEAARREVAEEAGYHGHFDIIPLYVFAAPSGNFRYYNFLAVVDEEFTPHLDWENQGYTWVEWGHWPSPMHFGLKAVFSDTDSLQTLVHYIQEIRTSLRASLDK